MNKFEKDVKEAITEVTKGTVIFRRERGLKVYNHFDGKVIDLLVRQKVLIPCKGLNEFRLGTGTYQEIDNETV